MATPTLTSHRLDGALGDILVDVRAGSREIAQPAVLLIHGFKGFKDFAFLPVFAERLARSGFAAVTASVSGSGVDEQGDFSRLERFARNTYTRELDDLHTVARALLAGGLDLAPPSSLGLLGHSRGGGMALLLAGELPAVRAVVTWSAVGRSRRHTEAELAAWKRLGTIEVLHQRLRIRLPLHWEIAEDCLQHETTRFDIAAAARRLDRPWLQVHGTADTTVSFSEAEELAAAAGPGHQLLAMADADHVYGTTHPWGGGSVDSDALFDATLAFLSRHLD
jgi:dienelactone hydrolase